MNKPRIRRPYGQKSRALLMAIAALEAKGTLSIESRSVVTAGSINVFLEQTAVRVCPVSLEARLCRLRTAGVLVDVGYIKRGPGLPGRPSRAMRLSDAARLQMSGWTAGE